jgi:hypothetical protein
MNSVRSTACKGLTYSISGVVRDAPQKVAIT